MRDKLWQVACLSASGSVIGGLIWLIGYKANYSIIEFDGPAGLLLTMSIFLGWLLFSVFAITLLGREILGKALLVSIIFGLVIGQLH